MRKIIYLIEQPLDARNFDRFGIQKWIDRNWIAEVWDLTPLAHPHVWRTFLESQLELKEYSGYFPVASKNDLRARYAALGRIGHFIDLTDASYCSFKVKRFLIRHGAVRVICAQGSIPAPQDIQQRGLASRLRKAFARGPIRSLKTLSAVFFNRLSAPLIRPGLAVVSGEMSIRSVRQSREILKVHSFDYDIYLQLAKSNEVPEKAYAVFIDQDLCFHSDFIYQNTPFVVTPEKYFPAICYALKHISRLLGVDILIAAHPRAAYERRKPECFPEFTIIRGRTADLIERSALVVCHDSTAIHFAVLFRKPMIFVTTDELIPTFEGKSIVQAAAEFGKIPINLDEDLRSVDWHKQMHVDSAKYLEYKNKYIKIDGSPERPTWDVVIDYIEKSNCPTSADFRASCATAPGGK